MGTFEVNFGRPIVTNGDFATKLFPNYFGQYLGRGWSERGWEKRGKGEETEGGNFASPIENSFPRL